MNPATLARARLPLAALLAATLLAAATAPARAAGTLYRWSEPDGSLTYSPTAPADGTPYDTVDAMTMKPIDANASSTPPAPTITRSVPAAPRPAETSPVTSTPPPVATVGTRPAPSIGAASADTASRPNAFRTSSGASLAESEKARRCSELGKRVISLEQRLATPLTPEAMDATVVQMARYQQNVERHCR